jgi:hypothetical protein
VGSDQEKIMTIIFLAYKVPDAISDELARRGHNVYECLAISEVFALAEEHFDAQIVIVAEMEEKWAIEIQQRYPTVAPETRCNRERCSLGVELEKCKGALS